MPQWKDSVPNCPMAHFKETFIRKCDQIVLFQDTSESHISLRSSIGLEEKSEVKAVKSLLIIFKLLTYLKDHFMTSK